MHRFVRACPRVWVVVSLLTVLVLGAVALVRPAFVAQPAAAQGGAVTMEYLGWSHYRFTSVNGKVILTNPWLSYPGSTVTLDDIPRADLILVPDGHADEVGEAIPIAKKTGARILAPSELLGWFREQGVPQEQLPVAFFNPGDQFTWEGITIRMVNSIHGSGINAQPGPTAKNPYGGPAAGFFITFENGWTVYHAGSTAATSDQALWAEMYRPDAAILPLNGGRSPQDFAMMVRLLSTNSGTLNAVFPHHHFPSFPGQHPTIAEAQAAVDAMAASAKPLDFFPMTPLKITAPNVRDVFTFTKS